MSKKLVSDLMVNYLERRDVKYVFGLCGHTVIGMLDALSRSEKVTYISNRHEAVASTAADGYARVTGKASVVMCHLGPGLTNVLTGVANAAFDSIPMVVIAGDVPSYYYGKHPHQEVNMHGDATQYKILEPVCKRCWRIDDVEALPEIMDKAFRLAESGRPGPVLIDMPMDMFSREMEEDLWARTYKDSHVTMRPGLDPAAAKAIAEKLVNAKNPVLHAGGGIILANASEELAALAEFLDIPVSRTLMGHGCLSDKHPLMIGQTGFWGLEFTHSLTVNADVILGLGTRFAEADSSSWYQGVTFDPDKTTFLQIDIDPNEIGRNYPVEIGAVGDLKIGLQQILDEVKKICPEGKSNPELRTRIAEAKAEFKKANEAISSDGRFPMTPQRILKDVKAVLPEDAHIFTDVGWNKNGVAQQFDITVPGTIHHSSGLATMGFGASAVLGGKVAAPDKICITLTGDGGFGVNPTCLATAVEQGIACTWVVMNNSAFGTIAGLENANYKTKFGTVFHTPDGEAYTPRWADVAKAYGVEAVCVQSADEFKPAMEKAIEANKAGRPFLVEAPMENIVVPTPGCWNINDIYTPNELVKEGKLVRKENGRYVTPNHAKSHNAK
ncbi:thiamine pyrophosphate-binding protein [Pseudoflavonifractor phocaeensis]|uniref:thiamine pyrophosphate-binding protein n=1 Tax=Pseudoflavonifractor phocaeensis TaxID=1870988 RepID=UPI001F1D87C5|nr:thiamine pyrophosphate-binding protein [Pseudoflavonifractor phocaeensis]MCF2662777.1 thiamine pyrophosphate-binding protein [Pseudoflavonifractor phocaeensis]